MLRIPSWSTVTKLAINDEQIVAHAGSYCRLDREWKSGDRLDIDLDMSLRAWIGERECAGKVSLFRGPLLLAWESTSSAIATGNDEGKRPAAAAPELDLKALKTQLVESDRNAPAALVLIDTTDAVGRPIRIRDFGTAGQNRIPYATWFPARGEPPMAFTRANPLRTFRIIGPHR